MQLSENLGAFNKRMAHELRTTFATVVEPCESEDGTLLFRDPIWGHKDPQHVGAHVAISLELDKDVHEAMEHASDAEREEMTQIFLSNLGTRVKARYDQKNIGPCALDIVGTMRVLRG